MDFFRRNLFVSLLGLVILLSLPSLVMASIGHNHDHKGSDHAEHMKVSSHDLEPSSPFSKNNAELKHYCPMHKNLLAEPCPHRHHEKQHLLENKGNGGKEVCFLSKPCERSALPISSSASGFDYFFTNSLGIQLPPLFPSNSFSLNRVPLKSVFLDSTSPPPKATS